ncbi:glycosyltransferase family 4 protein [Daejeonella oryzae]|uniref:glycosyltransferase family 4 protein n=1 Tax=Daejeonella oryzae TaxID=1122943 RepID=UPI00042555CE|nr:glycosyltransferase family 4 protein [Daejeonella oryzae]
MQKKKTNILSLHSSSGFGGDETRLLNICDGLDKTLFNIRVCTLYQSNPAMNHFKRAQIQVSYVRVIKFKQGKIWKPLHKFLSLANAIIYFVSILKIINQHKIDVLDCRLPRGGIFGALVKKLINIPIVTTLYHKQNNNSLYSKTARHFLKFSDTIICDSRFRTVELQAWIGSDNPKFLVIPSPIKLQFSYDEEIEKLKVSKTKAKKLIIGQIAKIVHSKGQDLLIDAFHQLANKYSYIELWIIGYPRDTQFLKRLTELVQEYNLKSRVQFLSYPGYIGNIFNVIDIQVHASRYDSLPNSILEGMSIGKPLIASTVGGIPEMVIDNKTGLLFDINSPDRLIYHLEKLIKNEHFRFKLGEAAKNRFDDCFSPDSMNKKLEIEFLELATKKK